MAAPAFSMQSQNSIRLADPALREALLKLARRRVPAGEVDDLVQNTLADALASDSAPLEDAAFRRWVQGIARHKIADLYRRRGRLPPLDGDLDETSAEPNAGAGELGQWLERELPKTHDAKATLHWLLRESEGETLDEIAREAAMPAPRVRKRVSRLRRHFQTRWLALGAAGLALLIGAAFLFHDWQARTTGLVVIAPEGVSPEDRARALRDQALERCANAHYDECLRGLDQAKALDPIGEQASAVQAARAAAARAVSPAPNSTLVPEPSSHTSTPSPKSAPPAKLKANPKPKPEPKLAPTSQLSKKEAVLPDGAPNSEAPLELDDQASKEPAAKALPKSKAVKQVVPSQQQL
ncbi:MAG TPA: sigma factor [Polyangiaceae bacterium]|jgi:DNA-directed RNA polymerase specialized sigma24 family protein|nr:sigma factor [Polyangiaceae bacterium]